ncbi:MAG: hypothetical protein ACRETF_10770 [Nevskiaceae bacterium]
MSTTLRPILSSLKALTLAAAALSSTGCMTMGSAQDLDAKFAAGWRPSEGYCAFGGETPTLGAYCAEVNHGQKGLEVIARAINEDVLARNGGEPLVCTDHVAQVRAEFAAYPQYTVSELYSCDENAPVENGRKVCHVSLLVASATGSRVVLDNGHVVDAKVDGGVAPYGDFTQMVAYHWTGETPAWVALSSKP